MTKSSEFEKEISHLAAEIGSDSDEDDKKMDGWVSALYVHL